MVEIELTQGKVAIIDDVDADKVAGYKWYAGRNRHTWYAETAIRINGKKTTIKLHRFLLDCPRGLEVDHRDGNGLNNTRANIRICTRSQNRHNQRTQTGKASRFKGVIFDRRSQSNPWRASIYFNSRRFHLGCFATEAVAALAYNTAATKLFGEYARPNVIDTDLSSDLDWTIAAIEREQALPQPSAIRLRYLHAIKAQLEQAI